jgi:hypothetical protein
MVTDENVDRAAARRSGYRAAIVAVATVTKIAVAKPW